MTVYLVLPPHMMERQGKWLRLVLTSALRAAMKPRTAGEPKILFMLDEFAALGHLKIVETVWAQVRGYGIQIMPVFQDLPQLKSIYGERWETFVANAGVTTFFAPNDITTVEWLSKRMGEKTVMMTTSSASESSNTSTNQGNSWGENTGASWNDSGGGGSSGASSGGSSGASFGTSKSSSTNTSPIKVPVMPPSALYQLGTGYLMIVSAGLSNAALAFAPAYYRIPQREARARENPYVHSVPRRREIGGW